MACVLVPAGEAIVTTIATKIIEKKENNGEIKISDESKERLSSKVRRLSRLLWGGSALLGLEHFVHGEIQPFPPFLTAAANPVDKAAMFHEMSTVGVTMAVLTTAIWAIMTFAVSRAGAKNTEEV